MTTAASTEDSIAGAMRQKPWPRLAEVLLIGLVFYIAAGDSPPNVNESHYLCRLKHFWNPAWCVGDLFLESSDTQVALIWLFGWVTRFVSLSATAWIGRVITWAILAWSWQRLSWRLVPRPLASVLSAAVFVTLNTYAHMAGEWIVGGVEAKCFAYAFVLLALRELIDGRWNLVWVMLGVATAFHPLVGGWSGVVCVGIWLFDARHEHRLMPMMPGFAAGGLLALVGILPALALTWNEPAEIVAEASRIYVFERLPHHLAPLALPGEEVIRRLAGHAALLLVLWAMSRALWKDEASVERTIHGAAAASPFRLRALRRIAKFAWGAALLACVGLTIELVLSNQPLIAAKLLRYYWFRLTDFAAPMAVALLTTNLIAVGFERRRKWATWILAAALILSGTYLSQKAWPRYAAWQNRIGLASPSDVKIVDYPAWVAVCDWVTANTPPNSLFITPRLNLSFKWRTGRPEVVNRKDIPQDARGIVEWHRRLKDIYYLQVGGVEQPLDSIGALGTERVGKLARKYHANYVLSDRGQLLSLPIAFWNEEYVVYRIAD